MISEPLIWTLDRAGLVTPVFQPARRWPTRESASLDLGPWEIRQSQMNCNFLRHLSGKTGMDVSDRT